MKNMTLEHIVSVCSGIYHGPQSALHQEIQGAVIDSRQVDLGYLFFAVKGERVDGHDFVGDVYQRGALCVIAEREIDTDRPYIQVSSSLTALKQTAQYYREQLDIPITGITGSVGKTSTKEFIASVLSKKYKVLKTEGNFNNEIGVPLTLLRIREEHEAAVVEMGISDFGEMHRLSQMVKPNICVITNIGLCHLENLGSRDGVLKAKSEIFDFAAKDCTCVLNGDDDKLQTITQIQGKTPVFYGMNETNHIYAESVETRGVYGTSALLNLGGGEKIKVDFSLPGKHMVYNAMAAAAAGKILGMNPDEIKQGIDEIKSVGGRLNIVETGRFTVIDDCYNANPVSVKSSLDVLESADTRKVAILGDMFELGRDEEKLHFDVGSYFGEKKIDMAFFVGSLSENTYEGVKKSGAKTECYYYKTVEDLLMFLDLMIKDKDTILVKASHSMQFDRIVKMLCGKN